MLVLINLVVAWIGRLQQAGFTHHHHRGPSAEKESKVFSVITEDDILRKEIKAPNLCLDDFQEGRSKSKQKKTQRKADAVCVVRLGIVHWTFNLVCSR